MIDWTTRNTEEEIMDDLNYNKPDLEQTLREIDAVNSFLGGHNVSLGALKRVFDFSDRQSFHILDLGCGSGDILRRMEAQAIANNVHVTLEGIDANPHIIEIAKRQSQDTDIAYRTENIFDKKCDLSCDILHCSLFLHHFTDEQLITLLNTLKDTTSQAIIINDLQRHPLAYHSISAIASLFSKSSMFKADAKHSVLRSFQKKELDNILKNAGILDYQIRWMWAFRWQVIIHL